MARSCVRMRESLTGVVTKSQTCYREDSIFISYIEAEEGHLDTCTTTVIMLLNVLGESHRQSKLLFIHRSMTHSQGLHII